MTDFIGAIITTVFIGTLLLVSAMFYPVALFIIAVFVLYKMIDSYQCHQQKTSAPYYQSYGYKPRGVKEDDTETHLSFEPKKNNL